MIFLHISRSCGDVNNRGKLSSVTGGKAALVEIYIVHNFCIEGGYQSSRMTHLIERHSVQEKEVVCSVTAMDLQSCEQISAAAHSGKLL